VEQQILFEGSRPALRYARDDGVGQVASGEKYGGR
jgi:hypothetical protein